MYKILPILLFAYGLAVTTDDIYDNSYALIIGINEYEHIEWFSNYAVNDAESIHEILMTLFDFPEENITILKNEEANKKTILNALSDITNQAKENDRVLIYFTGDGETLEFDDGRETGYLIPVDGYLNDLYTSAINIDEIKTMFIESEAKHILFLVDAANAGFPFNSKDEIVIDPSTSDYIQKIKEAKGRQIISAGSKGEVVIEKAKWGHSVFTMNLIRGLQDNLADSNKDGIITGYELGLYLKNTIYFHSENLQTPKSSRMSSDKGEFIFINNNYGKEDGNLYTINRDDIYEDSWAVIIGIDKYKFSDQLNYAVKDAEAVKDMLISKFDYPEENIRYLVDEEATLSNIKLNLGEVATSAGENDRILVFYSGHGQTLIGADKSEKGYIIPYEGKQDNPYATGIAMDEILTTSQISKSKHMLFLMDACYSGLMTEHVKGLIPQSEGYLTKVANEQARQIITAGGNEPAIEGGRWNHSVFTKNLLSGLDDWDADTDNDGFITADELGTYLRKQVTEDSNNQQTPQKGRFMNSGTGEFVFFSDATITYPSTDVDEKDEDEIIYGCMDIEANNYNPNATNSDRSCQYGKVLTSLSFGYYDSVTGEIPIFIDTNENLSGFMFDISGAIILKAWGGIAESTGYGRIIINDGQDGLYFFSYLPDGSKIELDSLMPKGNNQILINLIIETTSDENVCIEDIYLFDGSSEFYDDGNIISNPIKSASFCFQP